MAGIWLCDTSTDNVLKENTVSSSSWCCVDLGIQAATTPLKEIYFQRLMKDLPYGSSEENTLNNNTITASSYGLYTEGCGNNTISGNRILGNNIGISLT